jgi:hypothetical protein
MPHPEPEIPSYGVFLLEDTKEKVELKKAPIALARKVLCILYHLLLNREMYQENGLEKSIRGRRNIVPLTNISVDEMIKLLVKAGYEVKPKGIGLGG